MFQKSLLLFYRFWVQKSENHFFLKKKVFSVQVLSNWSIRLEKHQTLGILSLEELLSSF